MRSVTYLSPITKTPGSRREIDEQRGADLSSQPFQLWIPSNIQLGQNIDELHKIRDK